MKRTIALLLSITLMVAMLPLSAINVSALTSDGYIDSGSWGDNVNWSYDELSKTLTFSGTGYMKDCTYYNYNQVPFNHFSGYMETLNLVIEEGITHIGDYAFHNFIYLQKVEIPTTLRSIGEEAFNSTRIKTIYNYSGLNLEAGSKGYGNIAIRSDVTIYKYTRGSGTCGRNATWSFDSRYGTLQISGSGSINYGGWSRHYSDIEKIKISHGITGIQAETFKGCTDVHTIYLPNSVIAIGEAAFSNVGRVTSTWSISIPDSVTTIGAEAFSGCSAKSILLPSKLTKIESGMFKDCTNLEGVSIPETVEEIGDNAFYNCNSLTNVSLEGTSNLKTIGAEAFYGCTNLTRFTMPAGMTSVGSKAFYNCSGLTQVSGNSIQDWCNIDFADQYSNPLYYSDAFLVNENVVNSLVIPGAVSTIKPYAFVGYTGLTDLEFHSGVTGIGSYAFAGCSPLPEVTVFNELVDIGEDAFDESVVIFGYSGSASEDYATQNGNVFHSQTETVNDLISWNYDRGTLYITGMNAMPNYNLFTSTPWYAIKDHIISVEIDERITSVGTYSFYGCDNLVAIATDNKNLTFGQYSVKTSTALTVYGYAGGSLETYCSNNQFNFIEHLKRPVITEITPDTITVEKNNGWLYSLDKINWSSNNVFQNLNECTEYTVYIRRAEGLTPMAKRVSEGAVVTTLPYPTPDVPVLSKVTADTIEVVKVDGLEYSLDKEVWNSTGKFTELKCLTSYRVYARPITDIVAAQKISEPLAVTTPDYPIPEAPTLNAVTDTTISVNTVSGYEYSLDQITWTTTGQFSGLSPAQRYSVYVRLVTTIPEAQKVSEALVVTTLKSATAAPSAPVIENCSDGNVVIRATEGYEYSKDGLNWQTSHIFENIPYDTLYYFYQRVAETDTEYVSPSSSFTKVIVPSAPVVTFVGATTLSINAKDGYEYSLDMIDWQTSGEFENLITGLDYTVYCRPTYQTALHQVISESGIVTVNGKDRAEKPSAPTLVSKTDTTVTLVLLSGHEYSKDGIVWQSENVFEDLEPLTQYSFYQRVAENTSNAASDPSDALVVTTDKPVANKPYAPILSSKTDTTVTLTNITGCEYSKDGITWQTSNIFTGLSPATQYNFYQRVAETSSAYASISSDALSVTTEKSTPAKPSAPTLSSKTDTTVTLIKVTGYEYSRDGIAWQTNNVFTGLLPATQYRFYQRVAETSSTYASASSNALTVTTNKSSVAKPSAPTVVSKTDTTVTLTRVSGYEYKVDTGAWQTSNVFTGLSPATQYNFYQRVAETSSTYASASSVALSVTTEKSTPAKPSAPTLSSKTDTTVTLAKVTGYEYKMDSGSWQTSNIFTGLAPNSTHSFYQRVAATSTSNASASSVALSVTTEKSTPAKPSAPTLSSKTDTTVTLIKVTGYEYSRDGIAWQTNNVFTGLLPATQYRFYQRVAETSTTYASASSNALTVTTDKSSVAKPSAPTVVSKTDTTVTLTRVSGYEYKVGTGAWQTSNVFTGLSPATQYNFYQRVAETSSTYASTSSDALPVTTEKSTPAKPSAPTLSSKTDTKVTLTKVTGYEYSKDGITWQTSNVFTGLSPATQYNFYQRVAETSSTYASTSSDALSVTTEKSTPAKPSAPTLSSKTDTTVTLTKVMGYEYSRDGITWQSSNVFDQLSPDTAYTFYQRRAETSIDYASVKSDGFTVTTLKMCQADPELHIYDNAYDVDCNECGEIRVLQSISVTTKPKKLEYTEGEAFDTTGMVVTAYYNSGTSADITDYIVSGYNSTPGTKTITVSYGGCFATFDVLVKKHGWYLEGSEWLYYISGEKATGWQCINNTWYYLNSAGVMQTGWLYVNNTWYYLNEGGAMQTGWLYVNNTWYYLNAGGAMTTGWQYIGGSYYYLNESGAMQTGWLQLGGTWYYLNAGGAMQTGWLNLGGTWYYMNAGGAMQTGWLNLGGTWYYMNAGGAMQTGWQMIGGVWYYFYDSGAMATNCWIGNYWINAGGVWVA